jgi:hypothetical protein
MGAPRNTPVEIINMLNNEINAGLANPLLQARLADLGGKVLPGSPADFGKLIADDTESRKLQEPRPNWGSFQLRGPHD